MSLTVSLSSVQILEKTFISKVSKSSIHSHGCRKQDYMHLKQVPLSGGVRYAVAGWGFRTRMQVFKIKLDLFKHKKQHKALLSRITKTELWQWRKNLMIKQTKPDYEHDPLTRPTWKTVRIWPRARENLETKYWREVISDGVQLRGKAQVKWVTLMTKSD